MERARVWTHAVFQPSALAALAALADVITGGSEESDAWYAVAAGCDALILGGSTTIDGAALDRIGERLRVVARTGIGVDRIDLAAATARGVLVVNTPDGPTESTAEHAIALMLSLIKRVAVSDRLLRSGQGWVEYGVLPPGLEAFGATLGLVGLGRIGGRVAEIAAALGMRVLAYDPFAAPERAASLRVELTPTLDRLLASADVVSIHCPSDPTTRHLIDAAALDRMRPGAYLVNVSRGPIVDERALVAALRSGRLAGAALDVFDPEPPAANNPLFGLPNTICTSHIASYTAASVLRMQEMACAETASALRGERPPNLVNPEVWERRRDLKDKAR